MLVSLGGQQVCQISSKSEMGREKVSELAWNDPYDSCACLSWIYSCNCTDGVCLKSLNNLHLKLKKLFLFMYIYYSTIDV